MTQRPVQAPKISRASQLPRELTCAAALLAASVSTGPAWAEAASNPLAPAATEESPPSDARPGGVRASSESPDLAASDIEAKIRAELERSADRFALDAATVEVHVTPERSARIDVRTQSGETRSRELELPRDPNAALEVLGLVSASLVRNDADVLAEALRSRGPSGPNAATTGTDTHGAEAKPEAAPAATAAATAPPSSATAPAAAPKPAHGAASERESAALEQAPINLSLFHPLAILPNSEELSLNFELGLAYSRIGALQGIGVNGLLFRTERDQRGVAVAGVWSYVGGDTYGVNVSGVFSRSQGSLSGLSASGVIDLRNGAVEGVQVGGVFASSGGAGEGLQVGGVLARGADIEGMQVGGVAALGKNTTGLQAGGVAGVASDLQGLQAGGVVAWASNVEGLQIGGAAALADDVTGAQIGGVLTSASDVGGLQIGVVNVARNVRGTQIGIVNVADRVDGFPVGLVNAVGNGRNQLVAWYGGEQMPMNLGFKYMHGPVYTLLAVGAKPGNDGKGDFYGAGAGLGGRVDLFGDAFLELDGLWMHESQFEENSEGAQTVRGRAALGYQITSKLALFAGGGPLFFYETGETGWEPHYFAGIQVF